MERIFLVTGTRKGIGRHLAEHFLSQGETVVGCSREESDLCHEHYHHYCLDVSDEKMVVGMVRDVRKRFNRIDVLLNNAGTASMNHLLTTPKQTFDRVFEVNVAGTFLLLRETAKVMKRHGGGRIVNFSTVAVPLQLEGEAVYAASKAAVESLTKVAARELGEYGIRVNAVGPTPVMTDLVRAVPKDKINRILQRQAIQRFGTFEDVANVVNFLVQPESEFVTGQIIYLGGVMS